MIKNYVALVLCCISTTLVYAQFDKGQKVLGGSIGFSSNNYKDPANNFYNSDNSSFIFSPSVGWFNKTNQLSGIGLNYGYSSYKTINSSGSFTEVTKNHSIGAEFFSQRFISLAQNLFFTINSSFGGNYSFGTKKSTTNNVDYKDETRGYNIGAEIAPGLSYKLTKRLLFDSYLNNFISINYNYLRQKLSSGNTGLVQKNFSVSSSLSNTSIGNVGLGFRWLLSK